MSKGNRYDAAVIGAGVFGAWTAWHLARRGKRVLLADAYGPGKARASSAGGARFIRMGGGAEGVYMRGAGVSLVRCEEFFATAGGGAFFCGGGSLRSEQKFLQRYWGRGFFQAARKCFSLVCHLATRDSRRPRCRPGCFKRTRFMACRIWRAAG